MTNKNIGLENNSLCVSTKKLSSADMLCQCFALFVKKPIPRPFVVAAMIAGPALVIAGQYMLPAHIDPLFLGIAGTLVICAAGLIRRNNHV